MPAPSPPIRVNRAPVLTLWATVVADRLGYPPEKALTRGRFIAGSSARRRHAGGRAISVCHGADPTRLFPEHACGASRNSDVS
jgi:hypothetical protein